MRTNLFFLTIITAASLLGTQTLVAQNTSPYWSLAGNSNVTSTSKLGTTNAVPLSLFTSNVSRVYINAIGNVGIGTTAPAQKLHVAGNTYVAGNVGIGTTAPAQKLHVAGNTYVAGNVGIGTSVPSFKLEVQGGIAIAIAGISNATGVYGKGNGRGIYGFSTNGNGGYFYSANGIGLYATTGRSDKNYAAFFNGNVYTTSTYSSSDKNLKKI